MFEFNSDSLGLGLSDSKSDRNKLSGFFSSPAALIRVSALLVGFEAVGHMTGYPWTSGRNLPETQLVRSMKAVDFLFFGERSSYWNLYSGWGLFIAVLLLALAILLWLLSDLAWLAPLQVGRITAIISASLLVCVYLSFRFFYLPSSLLLSATFVTLLVATIGLIKRA